MRELAGGFVLVLGLGVAAATIVHAQEMPEGVTKATIEAGGKLFRGDGLCHACHGPQGKGIPNLGADLTDDEWIHSDGSLEGIIATITSGVPGDKSTVGTTMPPKGGSAISDEQVRAVAAYVWSLSHGEK